MNGCKYKWIYQWISVLKVTSQMACPVWIHGDLEMNLRDLMTYPWELLSIIIILTDTTQ